MPWLFKGKICRHSASLVITVPTDTKIKNDKEKTKRRTPKALL